MHRSPGQSLSLNFSAALSVPELNLLEQRDAVCNLWVSTVPGT